MKKALYHAWLGLRSFMFYFVMSIITIPYGIFCLFCYKLSAHARYEIINFWLKAIVLSLRYICGIKFKVEGEENIPKQNGVILANHQSTYETFLLPLIFHQPTIILKKQLLGIPFFGWGLRLLEPISVDKNAPTSSMKKLLSEGHKKLMDGRWVLIFPESQRVKAGKKARYRIGGALLAHNADVPVVPVAHNAGHCWPGKAFLKYPGTISVVIGNTIDTSNRSAEDILALAKIRIEKTLEIINTTETT